MTDRTQNDRLLEALREIKRGFAEALRAAENPAPERPKPREPSDYDRLLARAERAEAQIRALEAEVGALNRRVQKLIDDSRSIGQIGQVSPSKTTDWPLSFTSESPSHGYSYLCGCPQCVKRRENGL